MIILGVIAMIPSMSWGREKTIPTILSRIYEYREAHGDEPSKVDRDNVYTKFRFNVERRNFMMWLIPTMNVVADGEREYIRESYSTVRYKSNHRYNIDHQIRTGTIRRNKKTMLPLYEYFTPMIYEESLYDKHILSPFNRINRKYYRYEEHPDSAGLTRLDFQPKRSNTHLVSGYALVETETGRIVSTELGGEFDMISFQTTITMEESDSLYAFAKQCTTDATFRFAGNRISGSATAVFNNEVALTDSLVQGDSRARMDSLRPIALDERDQQIYWKKDQKNQKKEEESKAEEERLQAGGQSSEKGGESNEDKKKKRRGVLKKIFWDTLGETLVTPIRSKSEQLTFGMSPIINPLYVDYSQRNGISYKLRIKLQYVFSPHRYLTFRPQVGYNFKIHQFFFKAPLRIVYNPKRNGYAEIEVANGNRISNSRVTNAIKEQYGDTLGLDHSDMNKFDNTHFRLYNNIMAFKWLDVEMGTVFYRRSAVMKGLMRAYGMPTDYRSFAPTITLKIKPFKTNGPMFTANWERAVKGVLKSNTEYSRWEMDGQWKCQLPGLRLLNMRMGAGFYSKKEKDYFLDYRNFTKTYLPGGWDDEWSGDFQLLNKNEYNISYYYLRGNLSYESPLLFFTRTPYLGKYIEKERLYVSTVLLENRKPYYEIGYGFSNRYISAGLFTNLKDNKLKSVGFKMGFELFNRW